MQDAFFVMTSSVLQMKNISYAEKNLYALLLSLAQKTGFCFATNVYLQDYFCETARNVQRWILNLEKNGLIRVEGRGQQRKIFVANLNVGNESSAECLSDKNDVSNESQNDKNDVSGENPNDKNDVSNESQNDKNCKFCDKNDVSYSNTNNTKLDLDNKYIYNACAREGLYAFPFRDEMKEPFVVLTADLQKYQKEFAGVDVRYCLNRMQEWLDENPSKRPKKNMRLFIANWLKRERDKTPQPPLATAPLSRGADKVHSGASEVKTGVAERLAQEKSASRAALEAFKKRRGV